MYSALDQARIRCAEAIRKVDHAEMTTLQLLALAAISETFPQVAAEPERHLRSI